MAEKSLLYLFVSSCADPRWTVVNLPANSEHILTAARLTNPSHLVEYNTDCSHESTFRAINFLKFSLQGRRDNINKSRTDEWLRLSLPREVKGQSCVPVSSLQQSGTLFQWQRSARRNACARTHTRSHTLTLARVKPEMSPHMNEFPHTACSFM